VLTCVCMVSIEWLPLPRR